MSFELPGGLEDIKLIDRMKEMRRKIHDKLLERFPNLPLPPLPEPPPPEPPEPPPIPPEDVDTAIDLSSPQEGQTLNPGANIAFTGRLYRTDNSEGIPGFDVILKETDTEVSRAPCYENGEFSFAVTAPNAVGTYSYQAVFEGAS